MRRATGESQDSRPHQVVQVDHPEKVVKTITGVAPWMVVLILARELLVTSLRGQSESTGQSFGAAFSGKFKMVSQSVTILVILVYVNYFEGSHAPAAPWPDRFRYFRNFCIGATLVVTVFSGLLYVQRGISLYRAGERAKAAEKG